MHWKEHIIDNKDALIKSLSNRIGALKKISRVASFKVRKSIANGIFMSKLIYLMPVWIGCEDYLITLVGISQYHSLVLLHKTIKSQKPTYLYQKVYSGSGLPNTRQAAITEAAKAAAGLPKQPTVVECELEVTRKG